MFLIVVPLMGVGVSPINVPLMGALLRECLLIGVFLVGVPGGA
jgi:hypothetical protein